MMMTTSGVVSFVSSRSGVALSFVEIHLKVSLAVVASSSLAALLAMVLVHLLYVLTFWMYIHVSRHHIPHDTL